MNKSFWGILIIILGVTSILFIAFFQNVTITDEHNSQLLKEVTEAAMWDALDIGQYKKNRQIKIDREKFVANFLRRYAESASTSRTYKIDFYDVNEIPPKVSVKVTSASGKLTATAMLGGEADSGFNISNKIDAILEIPY